MSRTADDEAHMKPIEPPAGPLRDSNTVDRSFLTEIGDDEVLAFIREGTAMLRDTAAAVKHRYEEMALQIADPSFIPAKREHAARNAD